MKGAGIELGHLDEANESFAYFDTRSVVRKLAQGLPDVLKAQAQNRHHNLDERLFNLL